MKWNPPGTYGTQWAKLSKQVLKEEPRCRVQGCRTQSQIADHIKARMFGGQDTRANLWGICRSHHSTKTLVENRSRKANDGWVECREKLIATGLYPRGADDTSRFS